MAAYEKLSDSEYKMVEQVLCRVNATFWVAVGANGRPVSRRNNNYARAQVMRGGDTLYFHPVGRPWDLWVIPENEYRFVEGDVNTNATGFDLDALSRYRNASEWCLKHDCEVWELEGFEKCPGSVLKVGLDAPKPVRAVEGRPTRAATAKRTVSKPKAVVSRPFSAPNAEKVEPTPKKAANEPKKAPVAAQEKPSEPKKRPAKPQKVVWAPKEEFDPLKGVVNPRPQDRSGWKGTRKRRSCVTRADAYDSSAGCLAIGAMFARK